MALSVFIEASTARFSEDFTFDDGAGHHTLGMVGTGAMNRMMILAKPDLLSGFRNPADKRNVGLHEFAHLVDKSDGTIDGLPGVGLERQATARGGAHRILDLQCGPQARRLGNRLRIEAGAQRARPEEPAGGVVGGRHLGHGCAGRGAELRHQREAGQVDHRVREAARRDLPP